MIYCEDCIHCSIKFWEDLCICEKTEQPVELTDTACDDFEPMDGQQRLEI